VLSLQDERRTVADVDVVVVGSGPGGLAAAVTAARAGQSVALIDALDRIGGNAAVSTGYLAFVGSARQREDEIEDSVDDFLADLQRQVERERERKEVVYDGDRARLYAERSSEAFDFLVDLGVRFGRFIPRPRQHTHTRMLALESPEDFRTCFARELERLGVTLLLKSHADRLLTDDGRVVGVSLVHQGATITDLEPQAALARKGVVLATGGYQANHDLRRHYQSEEDARGPFYGVPSARGEGHLMGEAVGGQLINMEMIPMYVRCSSSLIEHVIAVNGYGKRFHDEAGPYVERVAALRAQPESIGYYIFDARVAAAKSGQVGHLPEAPRKADTIERLAHLIGCEYEDLRDAVETWNALVDSGAERDPEFGRVVFPSPRVGIVEPPFHVAPMIVGASFTAGGFHVTPQMQVYAQDGEPIPGLYAVGDCVGEVNPGAGLGGIHIASATTLGIVAGESVAQQETVADGAISSRKG
jgi:succinate dehydrogenase/fumarate reductase flavoprotein subunit